MRKTFLFLFTRIFLAFLVVILSPESVAGPLVRFKDGVFTTLIDVDNVRIDGNKISTTNTNGDLTIDPNGTGAVVFPDLTASTVLTLDASKKLKSSLVSPATLEYLDISSSLTSLLADKAPLNSPIFTTPTTDILTFEEQSTPAAPAAGYYKLYPKADGNFYSQNSGGAEKRIGTGSGGGINFITNPDAESDTNHSLPVDWRVYADSAAATPTDGAGGSPVSTLVATDDNPPLRGKLSFSFFKGTGNHQGEGFSTDFSIEPQDSQSVSKPIFFSFDYYTGDNYVSGDALLFVRDQTSGSLLTVKCGDGTNSLLKSGAPTVATCYFYSVPDHNDYRLIGHVATTNSAYWGILYDTVKATPQEFLPGAIQTEWVSYTPTFTGFGTVTNISFRSRRDGPDLLIEGKFTTGTPTAVKPQITLGYNGGNANVTVGSSSNIVLGPAVQGGFTSTYFGIYPLSDGQQTYITFGSQESGKGASTILTSSASFGTSTLVSVNVRVPIVGWPSGNFMSNQALHAESPYFTAHMASNYSVGANAVIKYDTVDSDIAGGYSASTGLYPCRTSGFYNVSVTMDHSAAATAVYLVRSGAAKQYLAYAPNAATVAGGGGGTYCAAGENLAIYSNAAGTIYGAGSAPYTNSVTITKITSLDVYGAYNQPVYANYSGQPTGTLGAAYNKATLPTKINDNLAAYSSGVYTVKYDGIYNLSAQLGIIASYTAGQYAAVGLFVNSSSKYENVALCWTTAVAALYPVVSVNAVPLKAGDQIEIRSNTNGGGTPSFSATPTVSYFSILRVGD